MERCRVKLHNAEDGYASSTVTRNRRLYLGDSPEPVTELLIPDGVTEIALDAFNSCKGLRKVVLPQGLKKIGCFTFEGCSILECIDIPEGVTEIGSGAFEGCRSLKHISLPASLTTIGHSASRNCESLTSVVIPDSVTKIGSYAAFWKGDNLKEISVKDKALLDKIELPAGAKIIERE